MAQNKRVNIAVAGLGRMVFDKPVFDPSADIKQGKRHVHTLLSHVPRAIVVAVCSTEPHEIQWAKENAEYKYYGIKVYESFDAMLNHPGLEALWISTSTDVHASQTLAGIEKGLHVLCEKPLSTDLQEVRKWEFLRQNNGSILEDQSLPLRDL